MTEPSVRIDDLLQPELPAEIVDANETVKTMVKGIEFRPDALLSQAHDETGLDDFGDDLYVEPMEVLLAALRDVPFTPLGTLRTWTSLVALAKQKLLITELLAENPEIHDIEIARPIIVAGQAPTGTSHLHNLISADPAITSLPYWESLEPVPPAGERGQTYTVDPRLRRCEEALSGLNFALPHFRRMHDMYPEHVHEETQLAAIGFSSMLFETIAPMPAWRDWYLATDQTPWYEFTRTVLKVLTFLRGGERWVLRSPQHVEQLGALLATYPDATVVLTHRDPVAVTASGITMMTYTARMVLPSDELHGVGQYWVSRFEQMFRAVTDQRDLAPTDQSIDIDFQELMADDLATVERIYGLADQPFTPHGRDAMDAFTAEHPSGKHGGIDYDLAQFDVDPAERRDALQFYLDRFGVTSEV